jgi:predicted RNA-binding protein YlxR (DUF448 family)
MKKSTDTRQPFVKHVPQRTCLACRQVKPKRELIRIVRTGEGSVVVDDIGRKAGRGAYLCRAKECWEEGLKGNRLEYVLRTRLSDEDRRNLSEYREKLSQRVI